MNAYAVIFSPNGYTPSVHSQNSTDWWHLIQSGYEIMYEGSKRQCDEYFEEYMTEHLLIQE